MVHGESIVFFSIEQTVFEQDCLRDIANFIEEETHKYKEERHVKMS